MKIGWVWLLVSLCLATLALNTRAAARETSGDKEVKVELKDVPELVRKAAAEAVKGIVFFSKVAKRDHGSSIIYEFDGQADGKLYEIQVSAEGKVLKVKEEKEGDEDDDDDEDEDGSNESHAEPENKKD